MQEAKDKFHLKVNLQLKGGNSQFATRCRYERSKDEKYLSSTFQQRNDNALIVNAINIAFKLMCFMKADLTPTSKNREQRTEVGNLSV